MKIENALDLPLPVDQSWPLLLDIPFVAPCLPGTELTKIVDDTTFEGAVSLKLGPVGLSFKGVATIEEVDPDKQSVTVSAQGREDRGRGIAHAVMSFCLEETETGTRVSIATDLNLAGTIVQYARASGVVMRTAQQLVDQFAQRLQDRIETGDVPDTQAIKLGSVLWKGLTKRAGGRSTEATDS